MSSGEALAAGITALAIAIAKDRDCEELELLSVAFTQLGDTLATISFQRARQENSE